MKKVFTGIVSVLLLISLVGCSTMVTIQSDPSGADVFINNRKMGKTPYVAKLDDFIATNHQITLKKDGFEDFNGVLAKEAKVGAIIGGIFFLIPFLWCYGPSPYQQFALSAKSNTVGSVIINNQDQFLIVLDENELAKGENIVEAGFHKISYFKDGELIATGNYAFNNAEYYEFKF